MRWFDKHLRYVIVLGFIIILIINQKDMTSIYRKIVGIPTYHKVTQFKFFDYCNTDIKYLNPITKKAERRWFWWWLNPPEFYDVTEGHEYVEWTENNLFYTDIKIHLDDSCRCYH